jgi:thioredoxin-like negative regulator of GroEL
MHSLAIFALTLASVTVAIPAASQKQESHIMELTADSYWAILMDVSKDVLVVYYAPWCQHC